jgi:hypothetical protein
MNLSPGPVVQSPIEPVSWTCGLISNETFFLDLWPSLLGNPLSPDLWSHLLGNLSPYVFV